MPTVNLRTGSSGETTYEPLPADIYYMRVRAADITVSSFKDKDGNDQHQLALTWEISRLTAEQKEDDVDDSRWVKQWLSLYYGETKNGPSKLKAFIDSLQSQGLLEEFDAASGVIDSDWFIGIEQRVTLSVKGAYNNVVMVAPLKTKKPAPAQAKNAPQRVEQAPVKRRPAPVPPVDEQGVDEEELF
jgi:hypothetical protein